MSRQSQHYFWSRLLGVAVSSLALGAIVSGVGVPLIDATTPQSAHATTSGGRSRGGSFGDDTPPPSSSGSSSSNNGSSRSNSSNRSSGSSQRSSGSNNNSRSSSNNSNYTSTRSEPMNAVEGIVLISFFGIGGVVAYRLSKAENARNSKYRAEDQAAYEAALLAESTATEPVVSRHLSGEITNNIVTITQIQVAMASEARHVQRTLNQIAAETDMSTSEGLTLALRETVVTLLRSPETWTHAIATSKTVKTKQEAKQRFEALSIEERSKFDVESMVNVNGEVKRRDIIERTEEVASHIVVTLIVGTAHDSAVIDTPVMSSEELRTALKQLGSITPDYLMVYEVLWSPQDESDSLTDEELMLHYPKMFQL